MRETEMENPYQDIIDLPHHVSENHPQMSLYNRAAQFAPFAALTGYGDAIDEEARYTESRIDLDENRIGELNEQLQYINDHVDSGITISVTYFKPDEKKSGGAYVETGGVVKRIDGQNGLIMFADDRKIRIEDIIGLSVIG